MILRRIQFCIGVLLSALSSVSIAQVNSLSFQTCDAAEASRSASTVHSDVMSQGVALFNFSTQQPRVASEEKRFDNAAPLDARTINRALISRCSKTSSKGEIVLNGCGLPMRLPQGQPDGNQIAPLRDNGEW